jgi:squalene-hopene/tetraprenyl-beta-curcumene cyclase
MDAALMFRARDALTKARAELLAARNAAGHWTGKLSNSALSTATAVCALAIYARESNQPDNGVSVFCPCASVAEPNPSQISRLIARGLAWLAEHVNPDGGWGDTGLSLSNISTTALVWAAFGAVPGADEQYRAVVAGAEKWLAQHAGAERLAEPRVAGADTRAPHASLDARPESPVEDGPPSPQATGARLSPARLAEAISRRYGRDRTFSVPILTMCALAGRLGPGQEAWRLVRPLPFELAACPHRLFAALRLPVVSYALPALIALGQARHHHLPARNPLVRLARVLTRARTLRVLGAIQPASGGFLEATPLTSFVVMSLAASGQASHQVTRRGIQFLAASARPEGSWPIDTNLATWVSTLAVNALGHEPTALQAHERRPLRDWFLGQQYQTEHPYTHAAPGGWAWTDLPGGVPDADDTAGALLALRRLGGSDQSVRQAAEAGVAWLLGLQNNDGGIPTFCRGWGYLPFDRSSPELTAHALCAWLVWNDDLPATLQARVTTATKAAFRYLARTQGPDGEWTPLWFGNQHEPAEANPTYGTAKVALALAAVGVEECPAGGPMLFRAARWLQKAQHEDGSWGGFPGGPPSVEETALALEAAAMLASEPGVPKMTASIGRQLLSKGLGWLADKVESGAWTRPSPIGFYFAKLWYYERLYPMIFTVGALGAAARGGEKAQPV